MLNPQALLRDPVYSLVLPRTMVEHLEAHPRDSLLDELQLPGGGVGEVDQTSLRIGTAIVDAHHDRVAIREVRDPDPASERQGAMRRGEGIPVVVLAVGGAVPVLRLGIIGGD